MKYLLVIIALICSQASAAEIQINCPGAPIKPGQTLYIGVSGLTHAEQARTEVVITPNDGSVMCLPVNTWGGNSIIIFTAQNAGKYKLEIKLNNWVGELSGAIASANERLDLSIKEDKTASEKLNSAADDLEIRYPTKYATCEVEVTDENPPPPPPPPLEGAVRFLLLREAKDSTQEMLDLMGDLRSNQRISEIPFRILDDEAKYSDDSLMENDDQSEVAKALTEASKRNLKLPIVAGFSELGELTFVDEAPLDANEFIQILEDNKVEGL